MVFVGETHRQTYQKISGRPIDLITNGYDEDDLVKTKIKPDALFSIAHIGSMVKTRNPETLWKTLGDLIDEIPGFRDDLEIQLIGKVDISVHDSLNEYHLKDRVKVIDYLPHSEVIKHQMSVQVLLLVLNRVFNAESVVPGKFFEYLAARRPILCIGPTQSDIGHMIHETQAGSIVDYDDLPEMKRVIAHLYNQYKKGELTVNSKNIERYSRKNLTGDMAQLLNEMTAAASTR